VAGDRPGDHRFSHALVRSAVAAGLSASLGMTDVTSNMEFTEYDANEFYIR
jgi:hypothetical protein